MNNYMTGYTTKSAHVQAVRFQGDPSVFHGMIKAWHTPEGDQEDRPGTPWHNGIATSFWGLKIKGQLVEVRNGDWIVLVHKVPTVMPHRVFKTLFVSHAALSDAKEAKRREERERLDREKPIPAELLNDCRKALALPPYNRPGNYLYGDGYFLRSLDEQYGSEMVSRAMERVKSEN